ncbi:hypothetical protein [Actinoallomurus iriomotensis]|nr:hypothetical protein [Actinoallomurus iriomotensis]
MSGKSGVFKAVERLFRFPGLDEEALMRDADHVFSGPRGRRIVFMREGFKGEDEGVAGMTSMATGNVFISGDMKVDPRELHETVRHELFHSVLTPRSPVLGYAHFVLNNKSGLYVYLHEAGAQAYGARNLWKGMKYPIKYGYVKPSWLAAEIGALGFVGYMAVGAVHNATAD